MHTSFRHRAAGFALTLSVAAAVACGDSGPSNSPGPQAPAEQAGAAAALIKLASPADDQTTRVEYTISFEFGAPEPMSIEGTLVSYELGQEYLRSDMNMTWQGERSTLTIIQTPSMTAFCSSGISPLVVFAPMPDGRCSTGHQLPDATTMPRGKAEILAAVEGGDLAVGDAPPRDSSECFSIRNAEEGLSGEICIGADGLMSYLAYWYDDEEGRAEWKLVSVSDDVTEADFELPFPELQLQELVIKNETNVAIFVNGHTSGGDLIDGEVQIPAGETGTLKAGMGGDPSEIYLGTYEIPQWDWTCTWDDAKAQEPLIVRDESANCTNTSP